MPGLDVLFSGPHAGFIMAAYAVTVVTIGGLIGWIAADYARQKAILADLAARGADRRSTARREKRP
jgi:heme exporter protein D